MSTSEIPGVGAVGAGRLADALRRIEENLSSPEGVGEGAAARVVEVYGAAGALGAAVAAHVARRPGGAPQAAAHPALVYVVADEDLTEGRAADIGFFLPRTAAGDDPLAPPPVLVVPAPESSPYAEIQPDRRASLGRMGVLFRLSKGFAPRVLVLSAASFCRRVFPRAAFEQRCQALVEGATINRDHTIRALAAAGYARASVVEDPGTFAVRGAVIDLYPSVYRHPVRIELDGDEIESIRLYDAATQRTLRRISEVQVHPVRESIRTENDNFRDRLLAAADVAAVPSSRTRLLMEQVEAGESFFGIEALVPLLHARMDAITAYLPASAIFVVEDPEAVSDQMRRSVSKLREAATARRAEHRLALEPTAFVLSEDESHQALQQRRRIELHTVEITSASASASVAPGTDSHPPRVRLLAESNATLRAELQHARADHTGS
ncbi:MAG: hypothetical protein ABIS92_15550, partial [Polyangia bacterium]